MGLFYNQFKGIESQIFGEEEKKKTEIIKDVLVFLVLRTLPDNRATDPFYFLLKEERKKCIYTSYPCNEEIYCFMTAFPPEGSRSRLLH